MIRMEKIHRTEEERHDCAMKEKKLFPNLLKNYSKHKVPEANGVEVVVEIHVQDISSINELTSEFHIDVMFSEVWMDRGLNYKEFGLCKNVTVDYPMLKTKFWNPNTCIVNTKFARIHKSPQENTFVQIYDNGTVWTNARLRVQGPCSMNFINFPLDSLKCMLVFESYSYNSEEVRLRWFPDHPISFLKKVNLPDFTLTDYITKQNNQEYPNGDWDQLVVTFYFQRRFGFYFMQAMDVFMLASTFFIFASLIELAIVSYSSKAWAKIHEKEAKEKEEAAKRHPSFQQKQQQQQQQQHQQQLTTAGSSQNLYQYQNTSNDPQTSTPTVNDPQYQQQQFEHQEQQDQEEQVLLNRQQFGAVGGGRGSSGLHQQQQRQHQQQYIPNFHPTNPQQQQQQQQPHHHPPHHLHLHPHHQQQQQQHNRPHPHHQPPQRARSLTRLGKSSKTSQLIMCNGCHTLSDFETTGAIWQQQRPNHMEESFDCYPECTSFCGGMVAGDNFVVGAGSSRVSGGGISRETKIRQDPYELYGFVGGGGGRNLINTTATTAGSPASIHHNQQQHKFHSSFHGLPTYHQQQQQTEEQQNDHHQQQQKQQGASSFCSIPGVQPMGTGPPNLPSSADATAIAANDIHEFQVLLHQQQQQQQNNANSNDKVVTPGVNITSQQQHSVITPETHHLAMTHREGLVRRLKIGMRSSRKSNNNNDTSSNQNCHNSMMASSGPTSSVSPARLISSTGGVDDRSSRSRSRSSRRSRRGGGSRRRQKLPLNPERVDQISMFLFPICFIVFNVSYWIFYLFILQVDLDDSDTPAVPTTTSDNH